MILDIWRPEPAPRRGFDLYRAERRAQELAFVLSLWAVRAYVLTKYRAGDVLKRLGGAR